jgi:hypothetical protein
MISILNTRRRPAGALACAAVAALVALGTAASAGATPVAAQAHIQLEDPVGDAGGAPDLGTIDVGNDVVKGPIVLWIDTPNRERLGPDDSLAVFLDTDQNPATGGGSFGIDYVIVCSSGGARLFRWDAAALTRAAAPTLIMSQFDKEVRIEIQPADVGGTRGFDFFVASSTGEEMDFAPDDGSAAYSFNAGPVVLTVEEFAIKPKVARAGTRLTAVLLPGRDDIYEILWEGAVRCTAKVGTTRVSTRTGWSDDGAFCSLTVPKNAKGKRVTLTLSVTFGGQTVSRSYRSVVR